MLMILPHNNNISAVTWTTSYGRLQMWSKNPFLYPYPVRSVSARVLVRSSSANDRCCFMGFLQWFCATVRTFFPFHQYLSYSVELLIGIIYYHLNPRCIISLHGVKASEEQVTVCIWPSAWSLGSWEPSIVGEIRISFFK